MSFLYIILSEISELNHNSERKYILKYILLYIVQAKISLLSQRIVHQAVKMYRNIIFRKDIIFT